MQLWVKERDGGRSCRVITLVVFKNKHIHADAAFPRILTRIWGPPTIETVVFLGMYLEAFLTNCTSSTINSRRQGYSSFDRETDVITRYNQPR
jgi:hypothetical protein